MALIFLSCSNETDTVLSDLDFPRDCTNSDLLSSRLISDDWLDSLGQDLRLFESTAYVLKANPQGTDIIVVNTNVDLQIGSWTILDADDNVVFSKVNFPSNDLEYGWDGRQNGLRVAEGSYLMRIVFDSPQGIENFVEFVLCVFNCDDASFAEHLESGYDPTNARYWYLSGMAPYDSFFPSFECN